MFEQNIQGNAGGLEYNVPTGDTHEWFVNEESVFELSVNGLFVPPVTAPSSPPAEGGRIWIDPSTGELKAWTVNGMSVLAA